MFMVKRMCSEPSASSVLQFAFVADLWSWFIREYQSSLCALISLAIRDNCRSSKCFTEAEKPVVQLEFAGI